ncbi:hypothetical protein CAPTEDRAFT_218919 [Capitella teleta]|uniref:Mitochondrial Rho GTPase n=1 Tax=Capitella teleta TaxID=283909 RepID=R7T454_CAPTE|nr:hypothetical protein CAPTEDRAFT_218919 [Capitella teleta]|eukprot:ELT87672.1 hypothetical protein CAPTEDRAFT_218919 [Capitella teleta]
MRKDVRILLVGEPGVGKTSLILSLVSEEFPVEVPAKAEEITIPADVTPEKVPTHIVDFSSQEQEDSQLVEEIIKAHVICTVYAVDDEESIQKIKTYWLPLIRQVMPDDNSRPVILVGNKSDILEVSSMETILPIMNEYAEVETCVECSAKTLKNISEVFYYAQKAVLHPTAPLYLPEEKERCRQALTRIFRICDQDNDDIQNDREIYQFQRRCFNVPLQPQALEDVKAVVRKHITDGVARDGITLKGFLFLHTLFVQRGRHETTWTVLRKFGYDDNLELCIEYMRPHLRVPLDCSTELTHQGYHFFASLFQKFDEDKDGCLSLHEMNNLFSTCPIMPWGPDVHNAVCTNAQGWITIGGYMAQWALTTHTDVSKTLEHLAYLGYMYEHDNQLSAIHVTREKKIDLQRKQTSRNVFQCNVIGMKNVGKTSFLQGILGRNLKYVATLNREHLPAYTVNLLSVYGQDKYLVLHEVDASTEDNTSVTNCDVVALLYDVTNPRSFEFIADVYLRLLATSGLPVLIVACKAEHNDRVQDYQLQPAQFCHKHGLPQPHLFTCVDKLTRDVYSRLATMAVYPHLRGSLQGNTALWIKAGVGISIAAGLGFLIFRYVRQR